MATFTINDLIDAISSNNVESMMMIHLGSLFNIVPKNGDSSFLQRACSNQAFDVVEYILCQPDIDINYQNSAGRTALHDAVRQNNAKICAALLKYGADPNLRTADYGETPLFQTIRSAFESGYKINKDIFGMLLSHPKIDITINARDEKGNKVDLIDQCVMYMLKYEEGVSNKSNDKKKRSMSLQPISRLLQTLPEPTLDLSDEDEFEALPPGFLEETVKSNTKEQSEQSDIDIEGYNNEFLDEIIKLYDSRGIMWDSEKIYRQIFKSCESYGCGCGRMTCRNNDYRVTIEKRVNMLKNMINRKMIPESIDGINLYMWVVDKIRKWGDDERYKILDEMNKVFTDRGKFYVETEEKQNKCSILEDILRNGDIDQLNSDSSILASKKFAFSRKCKTHKCTPLGRWLSELTEVKDLDKFRAILMAYGKASGKVIRYYANDTNWWRLNIMEQGKKNSVEIFKILVGLGFPIPQLIKKGTNITDANRAEIITNMRQINQIPYQLLKDAMLHQIGGNNITGEKLIINEVELIDQDPVDEIEGDKFILMRNGVAWDINNLIDYVMYTTKGKNAYDAKTKIESLVGKPIWDMNDLVYMQGLNGHVSNGISNKVNQLVNYINSEQYRSVYTDEEVEEMRRFGSVFGEAGEWFMNEMKKLIPKSKWDAYAIGRSNTDGISNIIITLKARYLLFYKEFLAGLSKTKTDTLMLLNQNMSMEYQKSVITGENCIMTFSSQLRTVVSKLGVDINGMNDKLVKNLDVVDTRINDKINEADLDPVKDADLILLRFPGRLDGKHTVVW